jgi:hypothetical protein
MPLVDTTDIMEGLDDAGNVLFFVGAIIDCIVRYLDTDFESGSPATVALARLEFSSSPMWVVSAICYVAADAVRVHKILRQTGDSRDSKSYSEWIQNNP